MAVSTAACSAGAPAVDEGPPVPPAQGPSLAPEEAYGAPLSALRAAVEAAEARTSPRRPTGAIDDARAAAELLRVLALREGDAEPLARARRQLVWAAAADDPEACAAGLALARLEARDAGDARAAYGEAYRVVRRHAATPAEVTAEDPPCVLEARRMLAVLDAERPPRAHLALLDADPSVDLPAPGDGSADVTAWAEERGQSTNAAGVTLSEISVYGQAALGGGGVAVARTVLRFDAVAVFERGEVPAGDGRPRRAVLDFHGLEVAPTVPSSVPVGVAGLAGVRRGEPSAGVVRVVFDLSPEAEVRVFFLTDPYRVVVDVDLGDAPRPLAGGAPAVRIVVLDPGHGGNEFGARYDGLKESELVLDITRRAAVALERRMPGTRVLMTRQRDEVISLEERTAMANAVNADLFVSVHLNAADEPVETGGITTFVLDTNNDRQALRLAARENGTSTREVTGLQRILADLHRQEQATASRRLAEAVHRSTLAGAHRVLPRLPDRGVRSAMFYVLVGARMPAILVETSFMTRPEEARALRTVRYRQALADGIADGIARYAGR